MSARPIPSLTSLQLPDWALPLEPTAPRRAEPAAAPLGAARADAPGSAVAPSFVTTPAGGPDDDDGEADGGPRHPVRAVFVSDVHLGTPGCQAEALLDFLKHYPSETLYLVGDIVDGWQLRRRWYWPQAHNDVVQKLLRRARKGCRVVLVPGNHDEFARKYFGHNFGGIEVVDDPVHVTAQGLRLWVTHGDLFDGVIQVARWLAYLGDNLYELSLRINQSLNSWRARLGLPYWSLSNYLKDRVKRAVSYIDDFERAVAREARRRGADGVVCGHIHRAEMRRIDGVLYCNDGDWVESMTALVEHLDGRLEIIHWHPPTHPKRLHEQARRGKAQALA